MRLTLLMGKGICFNKGKGDSPMATTFFKIHANSSIGTARVSPIVSCFGFLCWLTFNIEIMEMLNSRAMEQTVSPLLILYALNTCLDCSTTITTIAFYIFFTPPIFSINADMHKKNSPSHINGKSNF